MIRYGRPNGFLYQMYFNDQNLLTASISDGMSGSSILTIDPEKKEVVKDEYIDEYNEDEGDMEEEDYYYEDKIDDLKRVFPKKAQIFLSNLTYKLLNVDTVGYLTQGILPNDNSIFYFPHKTGKLKLIHNLSDSTQNDNIDGVWGTSSNAFYFLKDKQYNYFFKYDINSNKVTLLNKYPPHSHFTYIYSNKLKNDDVLLNFEVEIKSPEADEAMKLFRYSNGNLFEITEYALLQEVNYLYDKNLLLLYYLKNGKRCLDVRNLNL